MLSRSIMAALLLSLLLSAPLSAYAEKRIAIAAETESQADSSEEEKATAAQTAFEEKFELEPDAPNTTTEPDFFHILRKGILEKIGKKKVSVTPKVTFGDVFTGPSTYREGEQTQIPPASTNKIFTT